MKKTYFVAIAIGVSIAIWMASGLLKDHSDNAHSDAEFKSLTRTDTAKVRTKHLTAQPQRIEITLRGKTQAKRIVAIKAEMGGRVIATPVERGQRVKKGAVLCQLADDDHLATLNQARANYEKAAIDYDGALKLKEKNLLSATAIAASKAAKESAQAALTSSELAVERLKMRAPFDGFVESRPAQVGALMERSAVCAELIDESMILAIAQASEREVTSLDVGQPVSIQITGGGVVKGALSFVGRIADPQTRTYRIEATLNTNGAKIRDGSTVQMIIPLDEVMSYKISPAVLALDDSGQVGVRIVNNEHIVEFHPVQVVRENAEGVWVSGLPNEINLITVGQEFVADGDKVESMVDSSDQEDVIATAPATASEPNAAIQNIEAESKLSAKNK